MNPVREDTGGIAPNTDYTILAGGCFWGVQDLVRRLPGVVRTRVGYTGGCIPHPTAQQVRCGDSGHAQAVIVHYRDDRLGCRELLEYFFQIHDPTTWNRQGDDVGSQYRSAIFARDPAQVRVARQLIRQLDRARIWADPVVTTVSLAGPFYEAEELHQDYLMKNPGAHLSHFPRARWRLPALPMAHGVSRH